jgi:hypothetical protein
MSDPSTIYWAQSLGDAAESTIWEDGEPVPLDDDLRRQRLVAAVSAVTSSADPALLPGGVSCWVLRQPRRGHVLVLEIPRLERDGLGRATLLTVYRTLQSDSATGSLPAEVREAANALRPDGVNVDLPGEFDAALVDHVAREHRTGCVGFLPSLRSSRRDKR